MNKLQNRRAGASTIAALLVFLGAAFAGGLLGSYILPYLSPSLNLGSLTIGTYTINILSFILSGLVGFGAFIFLTRQSHTETVYK